MRGRKEVQGERQAEDRSESSKTIESAFRATSELGLRGKENRREEKNSPVRLCSGARRPGPAPLAPRLAQVGVFLDLSRVQQDRLAAPDRARATAVGRARLDEVGDHALAGCADEERVELAQVDGRKERGERGRRSARVDRERRKDI